MISALSIHLTLVKNLKRSLQMFTNVFLSFIEQKNSTIFFCVFRTKVNFSFLNNTTQQNNFFSLLLGWKYVPYSNSYTLNTELRSDLLWHARKKSYVRVKVIKDNAINYVELRMREIFGKVICVLWDEITKY